MFDRYEKLMGTIVGHNTSLVKALVQQPGAAIQIIQSEHAERVLLENQFLKSCTGRPIALMFACENEWDSPTFLSFFDSVAEVRKQETQSPP